ncbi:Uncharacterised protein [uncultured Clostridium sp.]|nr:Uncharacterised protein [uncultured Clostridium sp.]
MSSVGTVGKQIHIGSRPTSDIPDPVILSIRNIQVHPTADGNILQTVENALRQLNIGMCRIRLSSVHNERRLLLAKNQISLCLYSCTCGTYNAGFSIAAQVVDDSSRLQRLEVIVKHQTFCLLRTYISRKISHCHC